MLLVEVTRKWKAIGWMTAVWMLWRDGSGEAPQTTLPPQQQQVRPLVWHCWTMLCPDMVERQTRDWPKPCCLRGSRLHG